jgi:molybdate transport system substrate-binding protein
MKHQIILISCLLVFFLLIACADVAKMPIQRLNVVAPKYLQGILDRAAGQFYEENRVEVNIAYVPSDSVITRAKSDASTDLFLTASPKRFEILSRDTALVDSTFSCPFQLSLIAVGRADGPSAERIEDLKQDKFRRIAVVDLAQGYEGKLAAMALNRRRLWNNITKKIIRARSSEHLHSYLITKEVDAAVVFESSIQGIPGLTVIQRLDKDVKEQLIICGAVTARSANKKVAQAFLDLLDSSLCKIYKVGGVYQHNGRH